ncbi:MAG TPA: type II toxin-antitoxin system PemK/MazF family toxin [Streptosporangiaceae bacterium]|nr:type II toxin-antitoxin system PemK/MazF family toxin [Streptosporangiaceae bacterium]
MRYPARTTPATCAGHFPDCVLTLGAPDPPAARVVAAGRISDPVAGVIRLDSVTSVRKDRVGKLVGRLNPGTMEQVTIALRAALDL